MLACSNKIEIVKLEDYDGKTFKKPVVFLLHSSFYEQNVEPLRFLSDFNIVVVDVEKFPNALSRYEFKNKPTLVFIDSYGNSLFTLELDRINEYSAQISKIIKKINNSKSAISEEDLLKEVKLQNITANEQRNIVEVFFQNFNYNQNTNSDFNINLASLFAYLYKNNPDTELLNNFNDVLSKLVLNENLDPINGGLWSEDGNTKQLSSFLLFYNFLYKHINYLSTDLLKILQYNFNTTYNYFFSFMFDEKNELYFPSASYKPSFGLSLTEKVLTNFFTTDEILYLEKTFAFSYSNFENGDRFIRFANKLSYNVDYNLDLIHKLRRLYADKITVGVYRDSFSTPNLLLIKLLAQMDDPKYKDKAKTLLNSINKNFLDDTGLIKTHSNGVLYLETQAEYIEALTALYTATEDETYLAAAIKHANLTLVNFCNSKNKTMFCSDTAFIYLDKYFAYFSLPNYSLESNSKFANTLLNIYFKTKDTSFLNYSYRILSSFYDLASNSLEKKIITAPILTYLSSLYSLYTYPIIINVYKSNKYLDEIKNYSKEILLNDYSINVLDESVDKKQINEVSVCIETYCEKFNSKNKIDIFIKKFLEDNSNKLTRVINY